MCRFLFLTHLIKRNWEHWVRSCTWLTLTSLSAQNTKSPLLVVLWRTHYNVRVIQGQVEVQDSSCMIQYMVKAHLSLIMVCSSRIWSVRGKSFSCTGGSGFTAASHSFSKESPSEPSPWAKRTCFTALCWHLLPHATCLLWQGMLFHLTTPNTHTNKQTNCYCLDPTPSKLKKKPIYNSWTKGQRVFPHSSTTWQNNPNCLRLKTSHPVMVVP